MPVPETEGELEDEYDDYDEFDEDTMDVEDIPEDAEFEWCWDEEGRMKIEEVDIFFKTTFLHLCSGEQD